MDVLRTSDEGLQALAAQCAALSSELAGHNGAIAVSAPYQASSAAVGEIAALTVLLAAVLAQRVGSTGERVNVTGSSMAGQDISSAGRIAALGSLIVV